MRFQGEVIRQMLTEGKTYREIVETTSVSISTISYQARKLAKECNPNNLPRQRCEGCGVYLSRFINYDTPRCKSSCKAISKSDNSSYKQRMKVQAVKTKGGGCQVPGCGYAKCLRSLHFHHVDPSKKSFNIASTGLRRRWGTLQEELKKCILVCGNCHSEIHDGLMPQSLLYALLDILASNTQAELS